MVLLSHQCKGTNDNSTVQGTSQRITVDQTDTHLGEGEDSSICTCTRRRALGQTNMWTIQ